MRFLLFLAALPALAIAQPAPTSGPAPFAAPAAELSAGDATALGLVEGLTEFLPISSTGHLLMATHMLGLESEKPLTASDGKPLWYKAPSAKNLQGEPLTLKLAADTYVVVIQFGAIAAVALLYWRRFLSMGMGLIGRDPAGLRLLALVAIAFVPAAAAGLLLHGWIERNLFSVPTVIAAQVVGAGLMFYAEAWRRRRAGAGSPGAARDLTSRDALRIGVFQCAALWPGMSRSMTAMVGGYFSGLDPRRAAEFSFILGFATLAAATGLKSYQSGGAMIAVFGWPHVLLGCGIAAVAAALAVRFLVHVLVRHGLVPFAIYRIATALALAAWFFA